MTPTTQPNPFTENVRKHVANLIRNMSDDDLLTFAHEPVAAALGGNPVLVEVLAPTPGKAPGTLPASLSPSADRRSRRRERGGRRRGSKEIVFQCVATGGGLSMGDVIDKTRLPKSTVAKLLKDLRRDKRISKSGRAIYARYARDLKTAQAAARKAKTG